MVVVLTIKDISYLVVGLLEDLVARFCIYICDIKIFGCTIYFNSAMA